MRTSNILTIGGAFIALIGGAFGLLMLKVFLGSGSRGFPDLAGLFVGAVICAIGVAVLLFGRRRSHLEVERDERNFADAVLGLARKHGQLTVDQVCKVSGFSREEAQARMRALTGRGLFDLDFDQAGQMVWKLSPNAGQAQLAELGGRS